MTLAQLLYGLIPKCGLYARVTACLADAARIDRGPNLAPGSFLISGQYTYNRETPHEF